MGEDVYVGRLASDLVTDNSAIQTSRCGASV
jgi:hypothetical protein